MIFLQNNFLIILSIMLVGCGGGSEGENKGETKSPDSVPIVMLPPPPDNIVETTADIIADQNFNFSTKFSLKLDAKLVGLDQRAYINVCLSPDPGKQLDYNECLFRSPLNQNGIQESLMISHSGIKLIAQIWFYDGTTVPMEYEWQYQVNDDEQHFLIR
ncbi:hypothetical protein [Pseudoalteromonas denitrificans]|uniref:Uncharacterized protein n=1 Tax=Pseudoalteromonas denitrificans DSM 6059 TaxID=1123010 RepID=A0A1I1EQ89_9GAMM|nr:hypothetical protein [Pseudoalteromonas denitrificans]SFB88832.1 hypothetical protein SAMN02745724_00372 [Pseudoalteromonas denitrificans DSM 6059]